MGGGQTGSRAQVPWTKVGPGWDLVQYNAASGTAGGHITAGPTTSYLVDPAGGRSIIHRWSYTRANEPILG